MKVIVTGGAGFIGSALTHYFAKSSDDSVVVLDAFTYAANPASLDPLHGNPRIRVIRQDIRDVDALNRLVSLEQPDAIMHLAAETHVDRSINEPASFVETNVMGTYALLEAARHYWSTLSGKAAQQFRFIHISTDEVYGSVGAQGAFTETSRYDPSSPYSATKAAADHLVNAWWRTYGMPVIVANCSNNYGPRQFPEKLIPLVTLNALEGRAIRVYGDGLNVRDWLHVDDHVRALHLILRRGRPGESYAIGARCEQTNLQIVHAICDYVDQAAAPLPSGPRRDLIRFVTDRLGHDRRYAIDPSKIEAELGWRPLHDLASGLSRTIDWYLANRAWWERLR